MNALSKIQQVLTRHDVPDDQRAGILRDLEPWFGIAMLPAVRVIPEIVLQKPLCVFDVESTGTDPMTDRIITLAVLRIDPPDLFDGKTRQTRKTWMVNPGRAIPPDATRVHGITDEMVKDSPAFAAVAKEISEFVSGADFCGYNLLKFDVPILVEELHRACYELVLDEVRIVDVSEIFRKQDPRSLSAAVKKYCGRDHTGAHDAMEDVNGTYEVLCAQVITHPALEGMNIPALATYSVTEEFRGRPAKRLDLAGYIIEDENGVARYTLKKVQGVAVSDDPGFGEWMLRNSFPRNTCQVLSKILQSVE